MNPLPIVKMADLQKHAKDVVQEVKKEGYRFIVNRGNVEVVMISLPLYQKKFTDKVTSEEKELFSEWKGKTWRQILRELRKEDNKKPLDVYLKELMEWQQQFLS